MLAVNAIYENIGKSDYEISTSSQMTINFVAGLTFYNLLTLQIRTLTYAAKERIKCRTKIKWKSRKNKPHFNKKSVLNKLLFKLRS